MEVTPSLLDWAPSRAGSSPHHRGGTQSKSTLLWFGLPSHGVGAVGRPRCPNSPQRAITLSSSSSSSLQSRGRPRPRPRRAPSPAPPGPGVRRSIAPRRELGTGFTPLCLRSLDVLDLSCNNVDKGSRPPREGSVAPPGCAPGGARCDFCPRRGRCVRRLSGFYFQFPQLSGFGPSSRRRGCSVTDVTSVCHC